MARERNLPGRARENLGQSRFALKQRASPQIESVQVQEIEGEVGQRPAVAEGVQVRDAALVWDRDLAVEERLLGRELGQEVGDGGEAAGRVIARAAPQADAAAVEEGEDAVPVMLDFMDPTSAGGRLARGSRQLRDDARGHRGAASEGKG